MQISAHSALTLSMPRSRNWRKFLACLMCPKTGSTTYLRIRYRLRCPPCLSLARMACTSGPPFLPPPGLRHAGPGSAAERDPGRPAAARGDRRSRGGGRGDDGPDRADAGAIPVWPAHGVAGGRGAPDQQAQGEGQTWSAASRPARCGHGADARLVRGRAVADGARAVRAAPGRTSRGPPAGAAADPAASAQGMAG